MHLFTFTDENMTVSADNLIKSAKSKIGNCNFHIFTPKDFSEEFFSTNKDILSDKRGAGFWLYKPYFLYRLLLKMKDNELIMYCDAGLTFEQGIDALLRQMDQDIYVFGNKYRHGDWCKQDCLVKMNADKPVYKDHEQIQASVIIIRKTQNSVDFVKEWLLWGQMPGMIDDSPSVLENSPKFREHRHDQAILTNLVLHHGYRLHWWPVQYMLRHHYKHPKDKKQVIWQHHRKRNNEW